MPRIAEYGSWETPWTPERVAASSFFPQYWVTQLEVDSDGAVYACTRRGEGGGRAEVLRLDGQGGGESLTPPPFNVRTQIVEYGGAAFAVCDGVLFFIHADQRWRRRDPDGTIRPITAEGAVRYGAPQVDRARRRLICVREDHRAGGEPVNAIVAIAMDGDEFGEVLVEGDDFYAWPALSPDGAQLAWTAWNHPHVPWDVTSLSCAKLDAAGRVASVATVAPEDAEVACDAQFGPDGTLYFVSDRSDWWNYYRWDGAAAWPVAPMAIEFARPFWNMGTSDYRVLDDGRLFGVHNRDGINHLGFVDPATGALERLDLPYSYYARLQVHAGKAFVLAASAVRPAEVIEIDLATGATRSLLRMPAPEDAEGYISAPRHITFPSAHGRTGYGFLYLPANRDFAAPAGTRPPLLVTSHGGPTGCTNTCFNPAIQFWTSRGYAVFDINYAGSTGYGRPFRDLLKGGWGVVDVEDHAAAALHLAREGLVDGARLGVRGWSAGGYNTFACLAFADVFHAGCAYFGISDVAVWAAETHKLESRYPDYLVGPRETSAELWKARSPLHHADRIRAPLLMLQGDRDKITPPNQSERILENLKRRGVPVGYILFEGEGHGFRKSETNLASLQAELAFFSRIFGVTPPERLPPIPLLNAEAIEAAAT
ncbi:MAG: prolyl oligopeptidase family serine peptidase [Phenylobacterium sp.]|uniref:S9 family peptidase n=1 Tax=Phenylobacterium sp. TaxID=1871053 RepID=UPI0025EC53E0|nr:prolyl oligopeptidase family serine peptidase [Phenylobacterium sp.]MBI1197802.1 prolyl oligopeptidase family serine peptidase [Phenylobacterium sp.]